MDVSAETAITDQIRSRFSRIYGDDEVSRHIERLEELFDAYGYDLQKSRESRTRWSHEDAVLITYGDVLKSAENEDQPLLQLLEYFIDSYLSEMISTVHILPFFPSSSDAGFSVVDYKKVRHDLGGWDDIEDLTDKYHLMADLVINHTSRFSEWFKNYQKGVEPGKDYFIDIEETDQDFSTVTRPRSSPLLTSVKTNRGHRHVWTTFSADQIDLDFSNPDVLFEFIDIFLFYYSKGITTIRLDAIAYLWKKIGTTSIHLEETHEVVKLFRDIAECLDPDITLITETNVPFEENMSYFGDQDEAHMIYQFSLPPLLLHALLTENASYLTDWASELPELPDDCTFFNFTASHDGIGVRPLEGLVPDEEFNYLVESMEDRGGFISYKTNPDGGKSPYELNITYFDAFESPGNPRSEMQIRRFLCSQSIMLGLQGVPGIYFHNLTGTKNNISGVADSGIKRDINRKRWNLEELENRLDDSDDITCKVFYRYKSILTERRLHPAFHPAGKQEVIDLDDSFFAFLRTAPDKQEHIFAISNVTGEEKELNISQLQAIDSEMASPEDVLADESFSDGDTIEFEPFQTRWLRF